MKNFIAFVIIIVAIVIGIYIVFPKYTLHPMGQGIMRYNKVTGQSWRLNLNDGYWDEIEEKELKASEAK
ncbi:MAG: hypothetical protein HQ549_06250 [Candidatus Omnitrophica bacterium]|nr:hypothetical protein [Candidatus Omnitrophota bacterium]